MHRQREQRGKQIERVCVRERDRKKLQSRNQTESQMSQKNGNPASDGEEMETNVSSPNSALVWNKGSYSVAKYIMMKLQKLAQNPSHLTTQTLGLHSYRSPLPTKSHKHKASREVIIFTWLRQWQFYDESQVWKHTILTIYHKQVI